MNTKLIALFAMVFATACMAPGGETPMASLVEELAPSPLLDTLEKDWVFFPLLPAKPRVQFLFSFGQSTDVVAPQVREAQKDRSFLDIVVGDDSETEEEQAFHIIASPRGIGIYGDTLYIADPIGRTVWIVNPAKQTFKELSSASRQGQFKEPMGLYVDPSGDKYISDIGRKAVLRFNANDELVAVYGRPELDRPVSVTVSGNELFVADIRENEIEVYNCDTQEFVRTIGSKGAKDGQFKGPVGLASDASGNVFVSDTFNWRVQKLTPQGEPVMKFGSVGTGIGQFLLPKGIAVDSEGVIYVADFRFNSVLMFNKEGKSLMFLGGRGEERGSLIGPQHIALTPNISEFMQQFIHPSFEASQIIFVTSMLGQRKVSVFALGKVKDGHANPSTMTRKPAAPLKNEPVKTDVLQGLDETAPETETEPEPAPE